MNISFSPKNLTTYGQTEVIWQLIELINSLSRPTKLIEVTIIDQAIDHLVMLIILVKTTDKVIEIAIS